MTDTEALFAACRARVGALLRAEASIEDVERTIEAFPLPCEDQCALWLWAWPQLAGLAETEVHPAARQLVLDRLIALG
jgi:hypothetical protein